jgi:hypothetical protein
MDNQKLTRLIKYPSSIHSDMIDMGIYSLTKDIFRYIDLGLDIPVVISPFSELKNCVIGNDVFIHSGATI